MYIVNNRINPGGADALRGESYHKGRREKSNQSVINHHESWNIKLNYEVLVNGLTPWLRINESVCALYEVFRAASSLSLDLRCQAVVV